MKIIKSLISIILFFAPILTMGAEFIEGQDYEVIKGEVATAYTGGPIHVTEFFSYGCPWCYRLEASVSRWALNQGKIINFSKVPVVFNPSWANYARAYYIIDLLSLGKTVHDSLFKAIIVDKQSLSNNQAMVDFFTKNGVDATVVESALSHSPSIELRLKADEVLMGKFQINAAPTLVVNNQYKTNLQMAKTEDRLFEVLDYLLLTIKKQ